VLPGSSDADSAVCLGGVRFLGHGAKVVGEVGGASDLFMKKVSPAWKRVGFRQYRESYLSMYCWQVIWRERRVDCDDSVT
jgi:hypothetical protein